MWENLDFSIFNAHKEMEKMKMYCTVYNDGSSYVAYENLPQKNSLIMSLIISNLHPLMNQKNELMKSQIL